MGRTRSRVLGGLALSTALVVLLLPDDAWAWGPLAHLEFSQTVLSRLDLLPASLRILLGKCGNEFLYGSLAADIVVGKNLARYAVHCHNWKVGWGVFEKARGEPQRAFALGFLSHLAADTVAHNYYVPYKTVQGFPVRSTGHAYWELRYDRMLGAELWKTARRVTDASLRRHDDFLQEALLGSYVIPFGVSRRMFGQLLLAAKMKKWQQMSALYARERSGADLSLTAEEVEDTKRLAVEQIVGMLSEGVRSRSNQADPTGGRNLHLAFELRQRLRREDLPDGEARDLVRRTRSAFRVAIDGKLVLPELPTRGLSAAAREAAEASVEQAAARTEAQLEDEVVAREAEDEAPPGVAAA